MGREGACLKCTGGGHKQKYVKAKGVQGNISAGDHGWEGEKNFLAR